MQLRIIMAIKLLIFHRKISSEVTRKPDESYDKCFSVVFLVKMELLVDFEYLLMEKIVKTFLIRTWPNGISKLRHRSLPLADVTNYWLHKQKNIVDFGQYFCNQIIFTATQNWNPFFFFFGKSTSMNNFSFSTCAFWSDMRIKIHFICKRSQCLTNFMCLI